MSSIVAVFPRRRPGTRSLIHGRRWELAAVLSSLGLILTVFQGGFGLFYVALLAQLLVLTWTVIRLFSSSRRRLSRGFKVLLLVVSAVASIQAGNALHTISTLSSLTDFEDLAAHLSARLDGQGPARIDVNAPEKNVLRASAIRDSVGMVHVELALGFGRSLSYFPNSAPPLEHSSCFKHLRGAWYQSSACATDATLPEITLD